MIRSPWLWPLIILISATGAGLVTFVAIDSPVRPLIALWFLCACPGMAFVRLLRIGEGLVGFTLAIALSLALDAIVAGTMLYAGVWSPKWGLVVLIGMSMGGVAIQILRSWRSMAETRRAP